MEVKAKDLEFISCINSDGSGVKSVSLDRIDNLNKLNEKFKIHILSLSEKTYIARGFYTYVVRIKKNANSANCSL